jgi:hypothetical protein
MEPMVGLVAVCVVLALLSLANGVMLLMHVKGERDAHLLALEGERQAHIEAYRFMKSESTKEAAESKAIEEYQAEAIRQHRESYDAHNKTEKPRDATRVRDAMGEEYEVVEGY